MYVFQINRDTGGDFGYLPLKVRVLMGVREGYLADPCIHIGRSHIVSLSTDIFDRIIDVITYESGLLHSRNCHPIKRRLSL